MKYITLITFFSFLFLCSCSDSPKTGSAGTAPQAAPTKASGQVLPSITMEKMKKIFTECDYIDYIFYETNFSMSMDKQASIQGVVRHIAQEVPTLNPSCKAIGRVFFEIQGETYTEAEIFFEDNCKYFVFYENKKKVAANYMSQEGINHFTNLFKQFPKDGVPTQ